MTKTSRNCKIRSTLNDDSRRHILMSRVDLRTEMVKTAEYIMYFGNEIYGYLPYLP